MSSIISDADLLDAIHSHLFEATVLIAMLSDDTVDLRRLLRDHANASMIAIASGGPMPEENTRC
jgi:hypothetical protein